MICNCKRETIRLVGHAAHEDEHDAEVPSCVVKALDGAMRCAATAESGTRFLINQNTDLRERLLAAEHELICPEDHDEKDCPQRKP